MIEIREARVEDCGQVLNLLTQLQNIHTEKRSDIFRSGQVAMSKEEFLAELGKENEKTIVAETEGKIIGMIVLKIIKVNNPILQSRVVGLIDDFIVDPTYRKKGVGKELLDTARRIAIEKKVESLELNVWGFNESAIHFYMKNELKVQRITLEQKL